MSATINPKTMPVSHQVSYPKSSKPAVAVKPTFTWGQACAVHGLSFCAKEDPMYLTVKQTYAEEQNKIQQGIPPIAIVDMKDMVSAAQKALIWQQSLELAGVSVALKGTDIYERVKSSYLAELEKFKPQQ